MPAQYKQIQGLVFAYDKYETIKNVLKAPHLNKAIHKVLKKQIL